PEPEPAPPEPEPAPPPPPPQSRPGPGGSERKYEPKAPFSRPTGPFVEPAAADPSDAAATGRADERFLASPLLFEPECEDCGDVFDFLARGADFKVYLGPSEVVLVLRRPDVTREDGRTVYYECDEERYPAHELEDEIVLRMELLDGNRDALPLPGPPAARQAYFTGTDPRNWLTDIPAYTMVEYPDIYPGIDLAFYGDQRRLEYVFVVQPGADPSRIRFRFEGPDGLLLDPQDRLVLNLECGRIVMRAPSVYQVVNGIPRPVDARHTLQNDVVSYRFPDVAPDAAVTLQPALDFTSFLGGAAEDRAYALAVDGRGYAYVAGETLSGAFEPGAAPVRNPTVFVSKFRIADAAPVYSIFIGGGGADRALGIAADPAGNAYVCGETTSLDYPAQPIGDADLSGRSWDAFVTKIDPTGSKLLFSRRLGGTGDDRAYGVVVDRTGNLYLAGETASANFPATSRFGASGGRDMDAFVARFAADSRTLEYVTRLGGSGQDGAFALAADERGYVLLAGQTDSEDFPLATPLQAQHGGGRWDAFVTRLMPTGNALSYSTYLGGGNDDRAYGVALDALHYACVVGETASIDFPATNAVQKGHAGGDWDAFAVRLRPDGHAAVYASWIGGADDDRAFSVALDPVGRAHVAGVTRSTNLAVKAAVQPAYGGGPRDAFVAQLEAGGACRFLTYLGESGDDAFYAAAADTAGGTHLAGATSSTNLPVIQPLQNAYGGGSRDALLARIPAPAGPEPPMQLVAAGGQPGGPAYDFYIGTYEISNEEFVRFLNDAQANTNNLRGTNMFFDARGNAWFNPAMEENLHEMFQIADSRLRYNPEHPAGARYSISPAPARDGESFDRHPVTGVSWYGAVKYCNWLTIDTGRGPAERCYREGSAPEAWAPVTAAATNWIRGRFSADARREWLLKNGFRLPMDNASGNRTAANPFNEFYKAAAWNGGTNVLYGYGRNSLRGDAANYLNHGGLPGQGTTQVGWFNGRDHDGAMQTLSNENFYGVYDLSGNVSEWLNDPASTNHPDDRATYGGSWMFSLPTVRDRFYVSAHFTDLFRGFRVASTVSRAGLFLVRVPYYICLCGTAESEGIRREVEEEVAPEEAPEEPTVLEVPEMGPGEEPPGVIPEQPEPEEPPRPGGGEPSGPGPGPVPPDVESPGEPEFPPGPPNWPPGPPNWPPGPPNWPPGPPNRVSAQGQ
ncbi:MAG: SBBP repeat-containing protein, partial [Lentisphaerae bacterium]|nr:SBBP repeat-containing protein [Lentisphaerota bacterium]